MSELWTRLGTLWRREHATVRARFEAERRARPLADRVARGTALRDLTIVDTWGAPGGRVRLWLEPRIAFDPDTLRIGPGDPVRLWWDHPDAEDAVKGVVATRREGRLAVVVDDVPERLEEGAFHLDRDAPQTTFLRGERAIQKMAAGARLAAVLAGDDTPRFHGGGLVGEPLDAGLNGPQREAVDRALRADDVALIHGPPGTGKTRTLVEVIRQAVRRGERVLATAASNTAVDNLGERLVASGLEVVRVGHPARVSPALEEQSLDARLDASEEAATSRRWLIEARELRRKGDRKRQRGDHAEARALLGDARGLERDARRHLKQASERILSRADVVCATAAGAESAVADLSFDLVVLDEATQAVDPMALAALALAPRAVLAGDPRQLPPTVIDVEAAREGLGTTFFERLADRFPDAVRMLVVQHRMHEAIMAFPSTSMYEGRLVCAESVRRHRLEDLGVARDDGRDSPLLLIDSAGKGWSERRDEEDPSTMNPAQAERVADEVRRLLARGLDPADAAVISPYDAQVRLLRELLHAELTQGLEIGTVDGFQGREKEAIVVDLVRSNEDGDIGFLADVRRMNVALTRARRFLLVVGDSATLGGHPYYAAFLDGIAATGLHLSAWTD